MNEAAMVLPRVSVAVHDTVVAARGKTDPLAGVQSTAMFPSTVSLAVALNVKIAPAGLVACTVAFGGRVKTGAVVSCTVTVKLLVPTFPRPSVAVHVTVVAPNGNVAPLAGEQVVAMAPSMLSVADVLNVTVAPAGPVASALTFTGTVTMGDIVSLTVTVKEAEPVLPRTSVAVHVTTVAPSGNVAPLAGRQVAATVPSTISIADPVNVNGAPVWLVASSVAFAGTVMAGDVVSLTVTVKEADPVLPCASVAVHVTTVEPNGNVVPLAGLQLAASVPSMLSVAEALNVHPAPVGPVASAVAFPGTVTTGGVTSTNVTVTLNVPVV
jgi:acyl dehydratase